MHTGDNEPSPCAQTAETMGNVVGITAPIDGEKTYTYDGTA